MACYGWNEMEASHCYPPGSDCNPDAFELPVWEYELYVDGVCSVTGGYVYRGSDIYTLRGKYIYGDWCTGDIWALQPLDNGVYVNDGIIRTNINITSFGVDESNELFFCGGQRVYKLTSNEGDLNNDNFLNVLDVILLVNLVLSQQYSDIADFNNDQILNVLDVITLINIILEQKREESIKMDLKDKLNLIWKFAFLAVFTYGVMMMTCCSSSSSSCDSSKTQQSCSTKVAKQCGADCSKQCCAKK